MPDQTTFICEFCGATYPTKTGTCCADLFKRFEAERSTLAAALFGQKHLVEELYAGAPLQVQAFLYSELKRRGLLEGGFSAHA